MPSRWARLGAVLLAMPALAAGAHASFSVTLQAPASLLDVPGQADLVATFHLDCQSAVLLAPPPATQVTATVDVMRLPVGLSAQGPASVAIANAPCQTPQPPAEVTAQAHYVVHAGIEPPPAARTDVAVYVHGRLPGDAATNGQLVPPQDQNATAAVRVKAVLAAVVAQAPGPLRYDAAAGPVLRFNVTFRNAGNVPLDLVMASSGGNAALDLPNLHMGFAADASSGPPDATGVFAFHPPLSDWTTATVTVVVTPQLQTLDEGALHGSPVAFTVTVDNAVPKAASDVPAPALALTLVLAALAARRPASLGRA